MREDRIEMVSEVAEQTLMVLPTPRRRLGLLAIFAAFGGLAAYAFPQTFIWENASLAIMGLALIAGISALWSP